MIKLVKFNNFGAILIQQIYDALKVDENIVIQIFLTKILQTKLTLIIVFPYMKRADTGIDEADSKERTRGSCGVEGSLFD